MKKFTFFLIVINSFFIINLSAQIEKGNKLFSGSTSLSINKNQLDTLAIQQNFNVLFSPSIGRAVKKNLVFGYSIQAGYGSNKNQTFTNNSVDKGRQWIAGGGVFVRKYFPLGKGFSFSGGLNANFSHLDHKLVSSSSMSTVKRTNITKSNEFHLGVVSGLTYAFNKKWMADIYLDDFANFYVRRQDLEMVTGLISQKQKFTQIGFDSQVNYQKLFSNISLGFTYLF